MKRQAQDWEKIFFSMHVTKKELVNRRWMDGWMGKEKEHPYKSVRTTQSDRKNGTKKLFFTENELQI